MIKQIRKNDIAIIGIALRLPGANNLDELEHILSNKICCIDTIPKEREILKQELEYILGAEKKTNLSKAAYLKDIASFDNKFFHLSPLEAILMDPNQRIFLETAIDAIEDAGLGGKRLIGTQTGVFYTSSHQLEYLEMIKRIKPELETIATMGNLPPFASARLSHAFDLRGPSMVINTLCSSSLIGVHTACKSIIRGECNIAITGSSRICVYPIQKERLGIESEDGYTLSFTEGSSGTGGGEGSVVIILKSLIDAINSNDYIYGIIRGSWINHNGKTSSLMNPSAKSQEEVLWSAWKDAAINPEDIGYIEAFGIGTKIGDAIEIEGLTKAFRRVTERKQFCAIGSIKTNYGHLDCVSGLLGLIKAVLSISRHRLYPQLYFERPNSYIDFSNSPVYVNTNLKEWKESNKPCLSGISSFSSSGANCHLVLQETTSQINIKASKNIKRHFLFLSADNEKAFSILLQEYLTLLKRSVNIDIGDLCYSANIRNAGRDQRIVIEVCEYSDLIININNLIMYFKENKECFINKGGRIWINKRNDKIMDNREITEHIEFNNIKDIIRDYLNGVYIDFKNLYRYTQHKLLIVPLYPFKKKKFWLPMLEKV